eukprot:jgi/Picsp_1/4555/NSC_01925-R1_trna-specific adenosine deaminase
MDETFPGRYRQMVKSVLDVFARLPKKGKPQLHEYTTLASVVLSFEVDNSTKQSMSHSNLQVIVISTGTKCLPAKDRCLVGTSLNDCHAEVLARRLLLYWLYKEMEVAISDESKVLRRVNNSFQIQDGIKFHLVICSPPCGDAAIVEFEKVCQGLTQQPTCKRVRTGAKPIRRGKDGTIYLPTSADVEKYEMRQTRGEVRRKPGRGEPSSSVSCSDKIAKWLRIGFQGGLMLSLLTDPLYFESIILCGDYEDEEKRLAACVSLDEGVWGRLQDLNERLQMTPFSTSKKPNFEVIHVDSAYLHGLGLSQVGCPLSDRKVASGSSGMWWANNSNSWHPKKSSNIPLEGRNCEVVIGKFGFKAGFSAARFHKDIPDEATVPEQARSRICRNYLTSACLSKHGHNSIKASICTTYEELKSLLSPEYSAAWHSLRKDPSSLSNWPLKEPTKFAMGIFDP